LLGIIDMPQPSVFDPQPGVVKGDGRVYQTGMGNPTGVAAPMPTAAPAPTVSPTATGPAGAIQALIAALASAFAPKAITQAKQREQVQEEQSGLGNQLAPPQR